MARLTDARVASIPPPAHGQEEHPDDLVMGLRLRVGAGGRKAWIVRTRAGKKVLNKTLGRYPDLRLSDAREAARDLLTGIAKAGAYRPSKTFGEAAEHWLEKHAKKKTSSWRNLERRLEIHVLPHWRDKPLDTVRRSDVRELYERAPGEVTPNQVLAIVRRVLRWAMAQDWLEASPAEGIAMPARETPRDRFLSVAEARQVYAAADLLGYPMGGFVKILMLTGQRRTEVAAMRWADVDLTAGTWTLSAEQTKSGRAHMVPLSAEAIAVLKATPRLGAYVWTSDGESHISGFSKAKDRLDRFLVAAGHKLKPWIFHDLRRTAATHMVRLGVSETIVGRVLNHAPAGVTARVYALHTYADEKRAALAAWGRELSEIVSGNG